MTYCLQQLAVGSYDLLLDGTVIGSVVLETQTGRSTKTWHAELLDDGPDTTRPAPFIQAEHTFDLLGDTVAWLGHPEVIHIRSRR